MRCADGFDPGLVEQHWHQGGDELGELLFVVGRLAVERGDAAGELFERASSCLVFGARRWAEPQLRTGLYLGGCAQAAEPAAQVVGSGEDHRLECVDCGGACAGSR